MSESANKSSSSSSYGIGFAGLLTIIFIILKLNPGGHLTTVIAEWPWFEWWGVCVLCPMIWSFYLVFGIIGIILFVMAIAAVIGG